MPVLSNDNGDYILVWIIIRDMIAQNSAFFLIFAINDLDLDFGMTLGNYQMTWSQYNFTMWKVIINTLYFYTSNQRFYLVLTAVINQREPNYTNFALFGFRSQLAKQLDLEVTLTFWGKNPNNYMTWSCSLLLSKSGSISIHLILEPQLNVEITPFLQILPFFAKMTLTLTLTWPCKNLLWPTFNINSQMNWASSVAHTC